MFANLRCGGAFFHVIRKRNEKHTLSLFFFPEKIIHWDVILAVLNRDGSDYLYNYRENDIYRYCFSSGRTL